MAWICFFACNMQSFSRGDLVFSAFEECRCLHILVSGSLFYERPKGTRWENKPMALSLAQNKRRAMLVSSGQFFSDAVLWVPWVYRGTMGALIESDIVVLDATKFRTTTVEHRDVFQTAKVYAQRCYDKIQQARNEYGCAWDLPPQVVYRPAIKDSEEEIHGRSEIEAAEMLEAYLQAQSESEDDDDGFAPLRSGTNSESLNTAAIESMEEGPSATKVLADEYMRAEIAVGGGAAAFKGCTPLGRWKRILLRVRVEIEEGHRSPRQLWKR